MNNKLQTFERQQAQSGRAPQPHYQNPTYRPPNQNQGYAPHNQNRPDGNISIASANTNLNRALVPQNNLAQDQEFFHSCNYSYGFSMC